MEGHYALKPAVLKGIKIEFGFGKINYEKAKGTVEYYCGHI